VRLRSAGVCGEADPHVSREQVLLEGLDFPVDLQVQEEQQDERKQDQDYQVHPQNVNLSLRKIQYMCRLEY